MNSLVSIVACAIKNKRSLCDINGNLEHWLKSCRNADGSQSSAEQFRAEFETQMTKHSLTQQNNCEEHEGK